MKIAIVGSRTFSDYITLENYIDGIVKENQYDVTEVVSGGAKGADALGELYATTHGLKKTIFYADWKTYGRRAGFVRNVDIIKNCDICFAFWDGESHGTKHDIELCEEYNKPCYIYRFDE